jgi:hypothetical protein
MSTLTGKKIANTYKDLLQISNNNAGVDGTLRTVEDGEGTNTPLQLSNSAVNINGPSALQLNGVTLTATASVLNAVADLTGANGMIAVSGGQVYGRTLVGSTGIVITNDKGTEGNPTFTIATSIATSADVSALETSIANSNTKIAIVSALTSVNKAAITSINTVIDNLDYATSAELAAVSALTSVNKAAITSINAVIDSFDFATSAELATVSSALATSIANHLRLSGGTLTGQLIGTSATFSGAVCATTFYGNGSNLTGITASIPASTATSAQLASVSSRITSVSNFAVNLSATFATSINNSNTVIAAVSALTSVNKAAITSINTVIDNLDFATSAELAAVSALTSINKAAITSINTVIDNLDYATSAELAAVSALTSVNKAAITSINTVIDNLDYATSAELAAVSSNLATSIANHLRLSGGTLTGQLAGTSATFSGAVCATSYYGDGSNLTGITASIPASIATSAQLASVSSRITSVSNFAVNLSATFATSINNSNTVIAAVSALTSVNKAAITSINTVIDNLDYATSAELAAVSALTSVNKAAITSINTVIDNLDYATSAELAAVSALTSVNKDAITSINTVVAAVSALTSVNKAAITSINTVINNLDYATSAELATVSSTLATSIANHLRLTGGTLTGQLVGTSATFSAVVSANELDAVLGSFSTSVSVGANLNVVGAVSGTSAIFTGIVSTSSLFDSKGELRLIPPNSQTAAYTLLATDAGKVITTTSGGVTVPQNIFVAGNAISIYNNSANNQTITQGTSVTMYLGGTATTGNRTLAQRGIATVLCVTSNIFVISGAGLT